MNLILAYYWCPMAGVYALAFYVGLPVLAILVIAAICALSCDPAEHPDEAPSASESRRDLV